MSKYHLNPRVSRAHDLNSQLTNPNLSRITVNGFVNKSKKNIFTTFAFALKKS